MKIFATVENTPKVTKEMESIGYTWNKETGYWEKEK